MLGIPIAWLGRPRVHQLPRCALDLCVLGMPGILRMLGMLGMLEISSRGWVGCEVDHLSRCAADLFVLGMPGILRMLGMPGMLGMLGILRNDLSLATVVKRSNR